MDLEENVPSLDSDFQSFPEIGLGSHEKMLRRERRKSWAKVIGFAVCLLACVAITLHLLSSREFIVHDSSQSEPLVVASAALGSALIVGSVFLALRFIVVVAINGYNSVGFGFRWIGYVVLAAGVACYFVTLLIASYLMFVFYA